MERERRHIAKEAVTLDFINELGEWAHSPRVLTWANNLLKVKPMS